MAGLKEKEREEFLAKLFLPLGAWGTTAVPARAASGALARAVKGANTRTGGKTTTGNASQRVKELVNTQKDRLLTVYNSILKSKPAEEQEVIMEAIVGMESKGLAEKTISERVRTAIGKCKIK